jgi:hypothetical protein
MLDQPHVFGPPAETAVGDAVSVTEPLDDYLELYKLAVEMADRVSARRGIANSFFLTINMGVIALIGTHEVSWHVAAAGIIACATWWALLKSYRDLNRAKFKVIFAMEERLPVRLYSDEWNQLRKEAVRAGFGPSSLWSWLAGYRELGYVERVVPWAIALIYVTEIVQQVSS